MQFWTLATALSRSCRVTTSPTQYHRGGLVNAGPGNGLIVKITGSGYHGANNATETTEVGDDAAEVATA